MDGGELSTADVRLPDPLGWAGESSVAQNVCLHVWRLMAAADGALIERFTCGAECACTGCDHATGKQVRKRQR